jgi:Domain of unknown function (DUF4136)
MRTSTVSPGAISAAGAALLTLLLAACAASGPTIRTDADPSANLAAYKTFGYFDHVSTDKSAYTTIISTRLKEATRREMEKRGYTYVESNPDLLVNFNINIQNKTDVRSTPSASAGFYGYRAGMYGAWAGYPQDVETYHYQEGTLSIDLVDSKKQQLVWQGIAQGKINKEAVENPGPAVDKVVGDIFAKFPGSPPATPAQ